MYIDEGCCYWGASTAILDYALETSFRLFSSTLAVVTGEETSSEAERLTTGESRRGAASVSWLD